MSHLRIVSASHRSVRVELDGQDITDHISAVRLDLAAGQPTTATITFHADRMDVTVGAVDVTIDRPAPETTYRDANDQFGTRRGVVRADISESGGRP